MAAVRVARSTARAARAHGLGLAWRSQASRAGASAAATVRCSAARAALPFATRPAQAAPACSHWGGPASHAGGRRMHTAAEQVDEDVERIADFIVQDRCVLLDVRTPEEFAVSSVPGAVNIPLQDLQERFSELNRGDPVAVFCKAGVRSRIAEAFLSSKGFRAEDCLTVDHVAAAQRVSAGK
uniref:Rhodanese domain-containing protein n=1 Tax=Alexandrium monilatum TaxID=311494 RepID=A0A7S4UWQ1_9DINO